jgi:hypothetical protein
LYDSLLTKSKQGVPQSRGSQSPFRLESQDLLFENQTILPRGRLCLHSSRLIVAHPFTNQTLDVRAKVPGDIASLLEILRNLPRVRKPP